MQSKVGFSYCFQMNRQLVKKELDEFGMDYFFTQPEQLAFERVTEQANIQSISARLALKELILQKNRKLQNYRQIEILTEPFMEHKQTPFLYIHGKKQPVYLSISHSESSLGIGISKRPIGLDVEKIFNKQEEGRIASFLEKENISQPFALYSIQERWGMREGFIKLLGTGFGLDIKEALIKNTTDQAWFEICCSKCGESIFATCTIAKLKGCCFVKVERADDECNRS